MDIQYRYLHEVNPQDIIALMDLPQVRKLMPLTFDNFNEQDCNKFVIAKQQMWQEHGYGPWAFVVNGEFAGWGGLQPEDGKADLALVLHPNYWGIGKQLAKDIINKAFNEMNLECVTVLFPPTRTRIKGLLKLGFKKTDELDIDGKTFIRFELSQNHWQL